MNALNEVNKLLPNLNPIHRSPINRSDDNDGLTSEKFIVRIKINKFQKKFYFNYF
jgi:hypothetical protein